MRVIDQLDVCRDLLAAVLDARLTVASNNLNAIMKRLTAFTVVLMVPTLVAAIYGMNFVMMPELEWHGLSPCSRAHGGRGPDLGDVLPSEGLVLGRAIPGMRRASSRTV